MSVNLDEYIQRVQLEEDIFSKARLLEFLVRKKGFKINLIAQYLELSSSYVCNLLRILKLPELIRDGYYSKVVTMTHLCILARLHNETDMISLYEEILSKNLSTYQLEERVRTILHHIDTTGDQVDDTVKEAIERALHEKYAGVNVRIVQTRIKAKISIELKGNLHETSHFLEAFKDSL
jgi:ParB family transcriptional regulator, chromosome partitioning protein